MQRILKIISISLLLLTALNAVVAGYLFILDPSGARMGLSLSYIKQSPFDSYRIPGIVLLIANGLLNFVAVGTLLKNKKYSSRVVVFQGFVLVGWIVIQVLMIKDVSPLHVIMLSIGVILIVCGYLLGEK